MTKCRCSKWQATFPEPSQKLQTKNLISISSPSTASWIQPLHLRYTAVVYAYTEVHKSVINTGFRNRFYMGQAGLCFGAFYLINREDTTCAGCLSTAAADYRGSESAPSYTENETSWAWLTSANLYYRFRAELFSVAEVLHPVCRGHRAPAGKDCSPPLTPHACREPGEHHPCSALGWKDLSC